MFASSRSRCVVVLFVAGVVSVATGGRVLTQEQPPKPAKLAAEVDPTCRKADETLADAIRRADELCDRTKREAAAARLKTYRAQLALATKAGDFDRSTAIKAGIDLIESDPEAVRPKPKNVVRFEEHSYALIHDGLTWHNAKARCEQMGGHLVCLETPKEIAFVVGLLKQAGQDAWIGCSDEDREGVYMWINGKPALLPGATIDNAQGSEHSIHWSKDRNSWNDHNAGMRFYYVCEWDH